MGEEAPQVILEQNKAADVNPDTFDDVVQQMAEMEQKTWEEKQALNAKIEEEQERRRKEIEQKEKQMEAIREETDKKIKEAEERRKEDVEQAKKAAEQESARLKAEFEVES